MNEKEINAVASSIRSLSMDAIQKANSGHPGLPLGAAELAAVLYGEILKHNPADSKWADRDRFVLSAGHGSMLLYSILHLSGYKVSIDDIKSFRQVGSNCPGHPEYGMTDGVECTSGPLGQGIAMAVGMAVAETMLAARFNTAKHKIVDHYTYSLVGEGCLQEGVASEACSLAGHLKLGKLIVYYDCNKISIDGSTDITFTEDIAKRFEAYGWQVLNGSMYNPEEILKLSEEAKKCTDKPTLIILKSVIGYGAPLQGTADVHGAPLGADGVKTAKKTLGLPEDKDFYVLPEAYKYFEDKKAKFNSAEEDWKKEFDAWSKENPDLRNQWDAFHAGKPTGTAKDAGFTAEDKTATRGAGGKVLNVMADRYLNLVGGSADLSGPNKTQLKNGGGIYSENNRIGRTVEFGIREFAMSALCSGISLHGGLRPFCATFLVFSDYMRAQIRLASLMKQPVIYIFTHDSIYVGEDGPTHQPIEHLASYRAIPNFAVVRPADAAETAASWKAILEQSHPAAIVLSRQNLPNPARGEGTGLATTEDLARGAYVLADTEGTPDVILLASGSEVSVALEAREALAAEGVAARVVSVPCLDWFEAQDREYRDSVLPPSVRARVSVEAGIALPWYRWIGDAGRAVSIEHFGASAPGELLFKEYGIDAEHVAAAAKESIEAARS